MKKTGHGVYSKIMTRLVGSLLYLKAVHSYTFLFYVYLAL